jgi:alginate O-acetyltransferase complex protein AlgI
LDPKYKNPFILIASIFFYSWGAPKFIFVILGTTFLDFYLIRLLYLSESEKKRKFLLIASLILNLGLLFYFKYSNFFIENINGILHAINVEEIGIVKIILPIGISFYTFESITYVMDVYRKVHKPLNNFWQYQLYIILFPKLIAGPIVRFHEIADQIEDRKATDRLDNRITGFVRFVIGLSKKIFIANVLGEVADKNYGIPLNEISGAGVWIASLAYTFQIYFDFSGYSDMAIGLAKMMGFILPENFDNPYTSNSITQFWRKWHITLGKWMKNYLYIPLGGNRSANKKRTYLNLWIIFLASGLWHGASWNFIIWGALHGFFIVIERIFLLKYLEKLPGLISSLYSFIIVNFLWIFFRTEKFETALAYIKKMFDFSGDRKLISMDKEQYFCFILALFFSFCCLLPFMKKIHDSVYFKTYNTVTAVSLLFVSLFLYLLACSYLTTASFNPFIYFRF